MSHAGTIDAEYLKQEYQDTTNLNASVTLLSFSSIILSISIEKIWQYKTAQPIQL